MDEIKNNAPGAHTNAADSAAVARGDDSMTTTPITLIEAITQALAWELEHDPSVLVLGEDVGVNGGVFRATAGLQQRFGSDRILDTPLDETTIAGLTIGLAAQGMKPVAEAQFDGFMYPMVDHIVCHAARLRYRTRGRLHCPMVLRVPWAAASARRNTTAKPTRRSSPTCRACAWCCRPAAARLWCCWPRSANRIR